MSFPNEIRGSRLRAIRLSRNKTIAAVAKKMGYTATYIWDLEKGNRTWNKRLIHKYLNAL